MHEISFVKTDAFDKSIREVCNQRNDEWALVLGRISCVSDYMPLVITDSVI